uniref:Membrane-bound transport protein n=1 Tax=Thermoclostridium stercorarium TaxID=1510 RepID=Q8GJ40_THEST|nr:membrane-bound transport protein [Thermoclostridium stercorarium]
MLQISHLYAIMAANAALEDINLTLESGELLVVLGPSGCGKTTLLNLIAGFVPYQHGSIQLAGKRIEGPGADGVVFQNEGLLPWRNVQDNVAFGLQFGSIEKMQRLEIAHQMLKKVGLEGAEKRYIWQLSGGQPQLLGIARTLATKSQLLLLDEPFGSLDAFTRDQMQTLLLKLWQETGKQVLLITHDIEEAVFMATELVLLSSGPGVLERLRNFDAALLRRVSRSISRSTIHRMGICLSRVFEATEGSHECATCNEKHAFAAAEMTLALASGDLKHWHVSGFTHRMVNGGTLQLISPLFLPPPQQVLEKLLTIAGPQGFMDSTVAASGSQSDAHYAGAICSGVVRYSGRDRDGT